MRRNAIVFMCVLLLVALYLLVAGDDRGRSRQRGDSRAVRRGASEVVAPKQDTPVTTTSDSVPDAPRTAWGRVVDREGRAVAGALVRVSLISPARRKYFGPELGEVTSATDGGFTLAGPPPENHVELTFTASKAGYVPTRAIGGRSPHILILERGRTVRGRVVDSTTDKPIADAEVVLMQAGPENALDATSEVSTRADVSGRFEFAGALRAGVRNAHLAARKRGYAVVQERIDLGADDHEIRLGRGTEIRFALAEAGDPRRRLGGAVVELEWASARRERVATSDPDGVVVIPHYARTQHGGILRVTLADGRVFHVSLLYAPSGTPVLSVPARVRVWGRVSARDGGDVAGSIVRLLGHTPFASSCGPVRVGVGGTYEFAQVPRRFFAKYEEATDARPEPPAPSLYPRRPNAKYGFSWGYSAEIPWLVEVHPPAPYAIALVRVRGFQTGIDVGVEPIVLERAVTLTDAEPDEVARLLAESGAVPAVSEWAGDPAQHRRTLGDYYTPYRRLRTRRGTFGPKGTFVIPGIAPGEYALLAVTHDGTILGYGGRVGCRGTAGRFARFHLGPPGRLAPPIEELGHLEIVELSAVAVRAIGLRAPTSTASRGPVVPDEAHRRTDACPNRLTQAARRRRVEIRVLGGESGRGSSFR